METQLEIVCRHSEPINHEQYQTEQNDVAKNESIFQNIFNKLREMARPDKQSHRNHIDDDWEVPFERIRMFRDYQRSGSQGLVFYGKLNNASVAVKQVKDVSLTKIKHLRELNHKNVIKFKGVSANSSYYYIIMEYCPYGTLHEHIHGSRPLSSTILTNFAQQIANGMKYLHSKNIIHRDLKPSNILLTHNDVLKISDFGAHRVFNEKQVLSCAGTHAYMAPEVIRGEPYSFPIDVWSFGVVLWEILIGEEPYKNLNSSAVVWAVGNNSFRLPIPFSLAEGFTLILNGCWKAPNERLKFQQICTFLDCANLEVNKISKERWLRLQAGWKSEVRDELNKHLQFKTDVIPECSSCRHNQRFIEEEREKAQKLRDKNNDIYLKLQECCMLLQREREDMTLRVESVLKREKEVLNREESISERESMMLLRETDFEKLKQENLHLRKTVAELRAAITGPEDDNLYLK